MKSSFMRPMLALALALSLAACGGKASFTVAGTLTGVQYGGMVLTNNGVDLAVGANAPTFSFPQTIDYGTAYNVTVKTPPDHEDCSLPVNGADTAGRMATIQVSITCFLKTHALGGDVTGLKADNLQLVNGSSGGIVTVNMATPTFSFPEVAYGNSYGVTIFKQPDGDTQACTVSQNGTGIMGDNDVKMTIACQDK